MKKNSSSYRAESEFTKQNDALSKITLEQKERLTAARKENSQNYKEPKIRLSQKLKHVLILISCLLMPDGLKE